MKLNVPTLSIITPSFNQAEFIEETIKSVLSQEGKFNLEYIVMDGGSTDDSVKIIQRYDELLHKGEWPIRCEGITYRWSSGKDKGQADAVNKGFLQAKGEILGWLNSDDTYLPGALQKVVDYFGSHQNYVMIYGNAYYTGKDGSVTGTYLTEIFNFERLADYCFICQPSTFIRKKSFNEIGEIDISLLTCMDYDLWIRMGKKFNGSIAFVPDYLATSRMYEDNKTLSLREKVYIESMSTAYKHFGYVAYSWFDGYIEEILLGVHLKNKWPSTPEPVRTILLLPIIVRSLLRNDFINSYVSLPLILAHYLFSRIYSALVPVAKLFRGRQVSGK